MQTVKLSALHRMDTGKGPCGRMRGKGTIPGVVYGRNRDNLLVEFSEMEITDAIKKCGEHALVDVMVDGNEYTTMIKEIQRDPVSRNINHIDFKFIDKDKKMHVDIPILIKGEERLRSNGGAVQKQISALSVEASPDKLPQFLVADVSRLNVGDKVRVADVEFGSDITVADDVNSIVAVVTSIKEKETAEYNNEVQIPDLT